MSIFHDDFDNKNIYKEYIIPSLILIVACLLASLISIGFLILLLKVMF